MIKEFKNFIIGLSVLFLYLFSNFFILSILNFFEIDIDNFSYNQRVLFNLFFEFGLLIIFVFIYRKKLLTDFRSFRNCKFFSYIRYWMIAIGLMCISNIAINMFTNISTSTNQEMIVDIFSKSPIFIFILTVLIAPLMEELVFRLSLRKMFKTDFLFIIISGLFFGFMHVTSISSILELLYIIPYSIPGFIFAYTLVKSDNIFVPIGLHFIHNLVMIILQFIITFL